VQSAKALSFRSLHFSNGSFFAQGVTWLHSLFLAHIENDDNFVRGRVEKSGYKGYYSPSWKLVRSLIMNCIELECFFLE